MAKRLVYEVGLIKDGLPIVRRLYFKSEDMDPVLVGGFLSAIQDFSSSAFKDIPSSMVMERYIAMMHRVECEKLENSMLLYAICDKKCEGKYYNRIRVTLENLGSTVVKDRFLGLFVSSNIDTDEFKCFDEIFDDEIKPINMDYGEKAKKRLSRF